MTGKKQQVKYEILKEAHAGCKDVIYITCCD